MKCAKCPLYTSWNNESDSGEACGLFGDAWDDAFQYEDKDGNICGCYIDRHFIEKADKEYEEHLEKEAASWEEWLALPEPYKEERTMQDIKALIEELEIQYEAWGKQYSFAMIIRDIEKFAAGGDADAEREEG